MTFADFVDTLSMEEQREVSAYINFRREVLSQGYRPVIASSKGKTTKLLKGGDNSLTEFVNELLKSDMLALIEDSDPLLKAKLRGVKARETMLNYQGQPWKSADVADYLGISPQAVSKRRTRGKILGLSLGGKGYVFPSWQFESGSVLPGLSEVLSVLDANLVPDWDQLRFLITRDFRLEGKTPLECLQQHQKTEYVLLAAQAYGVQSAA